MRPWRASLLHSKQSRSMRPSSVRAPRRGRQSSSTSRSFTIGSACTRPWDTEPRPRLAPAWRPSPYAQRRDILIYPLHTKGGGPGAFGAFTWGVLDRLLEEDDLELDVVSGASAGGHQCGPARLRPSQRWAGRVPIQLMGRM